MHEIRCFCLFQDKKAHCELKLSKLMQGILDILSCTAPFALLKHKKVHTEH